MKKIFANYSTNQGLIFEVYRDHKILNVKMSNESI